MNEILRSIRHKGTHDLVSLAIDSGWVVRRTEGGHIAMTSPAGETVVCSSTPSDRRSVLNLRALLKRKGLDV